MNIIYRIYEVNNWYFDNKVLITQDVCNTESLDDFGDILCVQDQIVDIDDFRYNTGNYFKTEDEVYEYKKKLLYRQQYIDYIGVDIPTKKDWKNNSMMKHCAFYDFEFKKINIINYHYIKHEGTIFSKSKEKIENFIKEIGEENFKKYILEVEE